MRQCGLYLGGIGQARRWQGSRISLFLYLFQPKAAQSLPPFVRQHLRSRSQIERAVLGIDGNAQAHVAAVHLFVAHAVTLAAKH